MADEKTPRIIRSYDTSRFRDGGAVDVTVIEFMVGKLGPFVLDMPRDSDRYALETAMQRRADALAGHT